MRTQIPMDENKLVRLDARRGQRRSQAFLKKGVDARPHPVVAPPAQTRAPVGLLELRGRARNKQLLERLVRPASQRGQLARHDGARPVDIEAAVRRRHGGRERGGLQRAEEVGQLGEGGLLLCEV